MLQPSSMPFPSQTYQRNVTFGSAVSSVFRNYATFSGRASRAEYWWWVLFYILVSILLAAIDVVAFGSHAEGPFSGVWGLVTLLPALAVSVRRLHDIGRTGWWMLIALVPLIGTILLLVWQCRRGDMGPNQYGSDPLAMGAI